MSQASANSPGSRVVRIATAVAVGTLCALWIAACGSSGAAHGPASIVYYSPVDSNGTNVKAAATCSTQSGGSYKISITPEANSSDASRQLAVQRLAAHDSDYSLLNMDTIWTAEFAAAGWLKPITGAARQEALQGVLPIAAQSAEYKGTLYAVPLNTNAQLLWYRKDLLASLHQAGADDVGPDHRRRQAAAGERRADRGAGPAVRGLHGVVQQRPRLRRRRGRQRRRQAGARQAGGRGSHDHQGRRDLGTRRPSLSTDQEDQGRLAFEAGKAAFMLNWPYVYAAGRTDAATSATTKHVWQNMGWAPYPSVYPGVPGKSSVGGANIGISAYSKYPKQALAAALCMTRYYWQNQEAINEGLPPVTIASYHNPSVIKSYPFAAVLLKQLEHATNRPETPYYSDVTLAIQQTLHPPGSIKPVSDINSLRSCLTTLLKGGLC